MEVQVGARWRTSSYSGNGGGTCVEVGQARRGVLVRDTKDRTGGFLDPVRAVGDAFDDLRAHEVALFAGMRAALIGAIQRFDPKTLETELEKNAGGLGLNRKAKLWEQFAAFQQKLARDAEDDFNKVFGKEFMGTYMAQVKRLKSGG